MTEDEITQIKVGNHRMGIIGLKHVLEEISREFGGRSDDAICAEMLRQLSKLNYIPENRQKDYAQAFLREYKKFVGQPYEPGGTEGLEIKVLGSGCPCCDDVEQDLMTVMAELDLAADIEHVTDAAEIGSYGVKGTPALIINGEVKAVGAMPKKPQLKALLSKAATKHQ
jgi:Thioredoxin domain